MTRLFDILLSGIALIILLPVFIPVMVVLRLTGEGEIFFVQQRRAKGGGHFGLLKFATMLKNSPGMGSGTITVRNDPRILPFGRVLRKTKINELPQLVNIFRGDMSIIGPRPLTDQTFGYYSPEIQAKVSSVRPGLSGIGSIVFRSEEDILNRGENSQEFYRDHIGPYKGALEAWFVQNQSLWVYWKCIYITAVAVLTSNQSLVWRSFADLPAPPPELADLLGYPKG